MTIQTINSTDAKRHSSNIQHALTDLVDLMHRNIDQVEDPRFQALSETTAEVLLGLRKTFEDFSEGREKAWKK